jgi:hypothetical protein
MPGVNAESTISAAADLENLHRDLPLIRGRNCRRFLSLSLSCAIPPRETLAMILIHTVEDDVHALEVRRRLYDKGYCDCFILESNSLAGQESLTLKIDRAATSGVLRTREGTQIKIDEVSLIWFRRYSMSQLYASQFDDPVAQDLINNECRDALISLLESQFHGKWISTPLSTNRAANKILQSIAASKCGFRIPETLVTQSKSSMADFFHKHRGNVAIKPICGTSKKMFPTRILDYPADQQGNSFLACPSLCQEFIPGTRHIRLNCFGRSSQAVLFHSSHVDSRSDLTVPIEVWSVPSSVHYLVRRVLDELGLEMGIIDLKETPDGELVWLEVNPQGQFLYLEPLSNLKIGDIFVQYLLDEVRTVNLPVN